MKQSLVLVTCLFVLSGCWSVTKDKITLHFSRLKGSGIFTRTLTGFTCEDKGQSCSERDYGNLEKMRARYAKFLENLGLSSVKAKLKKLDGEVTGKYSALSQLPFVKEVRSSQQDQPGNRTDLILELHFEDKGDFKAKEFGFEFVSTDEEATIEEVSPNGLMDANRRSVTWSSLPGFSGVATVKLRLKGRTLVAD